MAESLRDSVPRLSETRLRGMTLIELLVVVVILTTLVAAAIPLLAPTSAHRQLREASRGLNTYLQAAQARAIAQGRPYGVSIKRLSQGTGNFAMLSSTNPSNNSGVSVEVTLVEQPPPYSGFDEGSAVQVAYDNGPNGGAGQVQVRFVRRVSPDMNTGDRLSPGWDDDPFPPGVIRPLDVVEVAGTRFLLTDDGAGVNIFDDNGYYDPTKGNFPKSLVARPINNTGQIEALKTVSDNQGQRLGEPPPNGQFQVPFWSAQMPYKVLRQPVPASEQPFQLPEGTAIDLRASGVGSEDFFFWPAAPNSSVARIDNPDPVIIMFAPEGRVWRVVYNHAPTTCFGCNESPVVDNVYLLVGANVPAPPLADDDPTLDTTSAKWQAAVTESDKEALKRPMNWLRGDSVWIVIGAASGRIATVENAYVDPELIYKANRQPIVATNALPEDLRSKQIIAAREFTYQPSQMGGR